jgi:mannose-1-phosphate guanylyltransferase
MKAFLLAAGKGERLRPLTDTVPKCLVPIGGKPLLYQWLRLLEKYGITDVFLNLHHLAEQVKMYVKKTDHRVRIKMYYEPQLLGSAGTVLCNKDFVEGEKDFFIFYADNLTNMNLANFLRFHMSHDGVLSMGLLVTDIPEQCGIVKMDGKGVIEDFAEKPDNPVSNLANAGVYIARQSIFEYIPCGSFADLGKDVLPHLKNKMYGYVVPEYIADVGTMEGYLKAHREWKDDCYPDPVKS